VGYTKQRSGRSLTLTQVFIRSLTCYTGINELLSQDDSIQLIFTITNTCQL